MIVNITPGGGRIYNKPKSPHKYPPLEGDGARVILTTDSTCGSLSACIAVPPTSRRRLDP